VKTDLNRVIHGSNPLRAISFNNMWLTAVYLLIMVSAKIGYHYTNSTTSGDRGMNDTLPEYHQQDQLEESLSTLVEALAHLETVRAIGFTGDLQNLPNPGQSDLDVFLYCTTIPDIESRKAVLESLDDRISELTLERSSGGRWGEADCFLLSGVETWLMYFTIAEARQELDAILSGQQLDRVDDFYPTGRPAMYLKMTPLYDPDGILTTFREQVQDYSPQLAEQILNYHLAQLEDSEDLDRAAGREDALFYHFALDRALDHYLQALFALNRVYFPSRKRSLESLRSFARKPAHIESRLMDILGWASNPETLSLANEAWEKLVSELRGLSEK
jgi:hypothetical protein